MQGQPDWAQEKADSLKMPGQNLVQKGQTINGAAKFGQIILGHEFVPVFAFTFEQTEHLKYMLAKTHVKDIT